MTHFGIELYASFLPKRPRVFFTLKILYVNIIYECISIPSKVLLYSNDFVQGPNGKIINDFMNYSDVLLQMFLSRHFGAVNTFEIRTFHEISSIVSIN